MMLITLEGIVTLVRLVQPPKALLPMLVTLDGITILVRFLQLLFVAHVDNQRVACDTVEKSYRGCLKDVNLCRFNNFNLY